MGAYDPQGREIVLALARVLRHAGVTFGVLRKEKCTGDPARRLGNDLAVLAGGRSEIETLRAAKVGKMVSICPHCVRTIGTDWREYGATFEIEHHSELLARLQRPPARAPPARARRVVFHDPCYLGRYRGVYEEPREVVGRYGEVIDPAPRARAVVLLRRRRRPDVPGRGERQARQRGARRRAGCDRRRGHRHGLPVLPDHVPRRAGHGDAARPRSCWTSRRSPPPACRRSNRIQPRDIGEGCYNRFVGGSRPLLISPVCSLGRVAQLAEQVTLNH